MKAPNFMLSLAETKQPLVSVIVPTFNRPGMLKETLASIEAQTYIPIEIIVVNDAGVDIDPILLDLKFRRRIVCLKHGTNKGPSAARNTGLKAASGDYIAYVDDDDVYYPDHIDTLVSFLLRSGHKVAYTDAYRVSQRKRRNFLNRLFSLYGLSRLRWRSQSLRRNSRPLKPYFDQPCLKSSDSRVDMFFRCDDKDLVVNRTIEYSDDFDRDTLLVKNFVPIVCLMHHRSCLDRAGLFDETLTTHEDWDLWIRMSQEHVFGHIKALTCEYRQRSDGSNRSSYMRDDFRRTMEIIHERYRHCTTNPKVAEAQKAVSLRVVS